MFSRGAKKLVSLVFFENREQNREDFTGGHFFKKGGNGKFDGFPPYLSVILFSLSYFI